MKATKEQFQRFRKLQYSCVINMNDIVRGSMLANLPEDIYIDIMWNYRKYSEQYK